MRDDQGTVSFRKVRHQPHREAAGAAFDSGRPGHCGPGDGFPRDAASRGLAATGGRVDQAARSAFQRFRQPFSPCKDAMALLPQFGPFPNYCLVSVCWMLIWKAGNFDWKRSSPMDDSKIDSTTCATSPTTKTVVGCEPATCRAISPASPTSPSPSFASRGASIPSPKPTGTTPVGPRTPYASSSTRQIAEPHATANPPRLAPPPRQRARSPAVQSELPVYFIYHSKRPRYPPSCRPEPPIPPATAPPQRIPTNHVLILAPNKISPWLRKRWPVKPLLAHRGSHVREPERQNRFIPAIEHRWICVGSLS